MKVDVHSLGTLQELAHLGAERAASSFSDLAAVNAHVEVTNISVVSHEDLKTDLEKSEYLVVRVDFAGGLQGRMFLTFESERATPVLTDRLSLETAAITESAIKEIGNIMTSGFIDGWADYLDTSIDITPPRFSTGIGDQIVPDSTHLDVEFDHVFLFESRMSVIDEDIEFQLWMVPERESFNRLLGGNGRDSLEAISIEKLAVFTDMTRSGTGEAAQNVSMMTGIDTEVEVSRLRFIPVETAPAHVGNDRYVGVVFEYEGIPSGYLAILFDPEAAERLINALLPMDDTDPSDEWSEIERSAMLELGNIMTSGFIDGWANVLETSIDHSPPQFVYDMGSSIMSPIAGQLGMDQEYVFIVDSTIRTDTEIIGCEIYALPNQAELGRALETMATDRRDQLTADPEAIFQGEQ